MMCITKGDDPRFAQLRETAADRFSCQAQIVSDVAARHWDMYFAITVHIVCLARGKFNQKSRNFVHRTFATQHHEVLLQGCDMMQCCGDKPVVQFGVHPDDAERVMPIGDDIPVSDRFTVDMLDTIFTEPNHVTGIGKSDDLTTASFSYVHQTHDPARDVKDKIGIIPLMEKMLAGAQLALSRTMTPWTGCAQARFLSRDI